jgi:hypothetical protein
MVNESRGWIEGPRGGYGHTQILGEGVAGQLMNGRGDPVDDGVGAAVGVSRNSKRTFGRRLPGREEGGPQVGPAEIDGDDREHGGSISPAVWK